MATSSPAGLRGPLVVLLVSAALVAASCTQQGTILPSAQTITGSAEPAADFSVVTFAGPTFSLSGHLAEDGRPVFLNLWASWCFPCRAEMPDIDEAATRHPDVAFIGIAVADDVDRARDFADEIAVGYPLAFDENDLVENGYRPVGLPATYLISPDGVIVETIFGPLTADQIDDKLELHFGS
ncbi:MAG: hypothetical protein BMS9Abin07_1368 [Acidimicrobiia bacterium]|nr:MAG: hypothetical protein BMS9Abin07_1368 [Acidimicrobiia bacterium]